MLADPTIESSASDCSRSYDQFAAVYNEWLGRDFCHRALPIIKKLVLHGLPEHSRILDVCCGTGQMAGALAQSGYEVIGVDASLQMIRVARENAPSARFIQADARDFNLPGHFDAAISTFNSFAHMENARDLTRAFAKIRRTLLPGAPLLFDLSMEGAYASKWRGSFGTVTSDYACVVLPSYDAASRTASNHITFFDRQGEVWLRSDFNIIQKCHTEAEIRCALETAGYGQVCSYDAELDLGMDGEIGRRFFLCR